MQPEFQQSFLFMFLKVPQIQFMIRVPDIPVACRDGYAQCQALQKTFYKCRYGGRRSCELQRKLQQFPVGMVWVLFLRNAWFDCGYVFCDSFWVAFVRVSYVKVVLGS